MVRKGWFLLWNREIPNNKSFDFVREQESQILRVAPVRWWLLLALFPLGCVAAWGSRNRAALLWILGFMACYSAGLMAFFVNSRFRLPLWPAMAILAGGGAILLANMVRQRNPGKLLASVCMFVIVTILSIVNWADIELPNYSRDYFFRSAAHLYKGNLIAAELDAISSSELEPADAAARFQLGNVQLALGKHQDALISFTAASKLAPHEPATFNNIGIAQEKLGGHSAAYRNYLRAIAVNPDYSPAQVNAALLEIRAGLLREAQMKIAQVARHQASAHLYVAQSILAHARGDHETSQRFLELAKQHNPQAVPLILEDMSKPIDLKIGEGNRPSK
jgi:lipoprotein NlpI